MNEFDEMLYEMSDKNCSICNDYVQFYIEKRDNGIFERIGYCRGCGATYSDFIDN